MIIALSDLHTNNLKTHDEGYNDAKKALLYTNVLDCVRNRSYDFKHSSKIIDNRTGAVAR